MKKIFFLFFIIFYCFSFGQSEKLQGNWILEKIRYSNGNLLEINHPLFSSFVEYQFNGNILKINGQNMDVEIDSSKISSNFRTLNYKFEKENLVINERGDNKIYFFLDQKAFLNKYPEFRPKEIDYENKKVFVSNEIIYPQFNNSKKLDDFLKDNIPSYSSICITNNFFEIKFILSKENKISDVKVIKSISKAFDEQFVIALLKAEKYFRNNTNQDLLMTHRFNFFKMFESITNNDERKLNKIYESGRIFFEKNNFSKSIEKYEQINDLNLTPDLKSRWSYTVEQIYINLGISYLATNQIEKSCEVFKKVGDNTNFKVRNYLNTFCK